MYARAEKTQAYSGSFKPQKKIPALPKVADKGPISGATGTFDPILNIYAAKASDKLEDIAIRFGTTTMNLASYNPLLSEANPLMFMGKMSLIEGQLLVVAHSSAKAESSAAHGTDEYYSMNGQFIGVGGSTSNKKLMVLDDDLAKKLTEQVKKNGYMDNDFKSKLVRVIPTPKVVGCFEKAFHEMEKPSDKKREAQHHEEALAVATNDAGEEDVEFSPPGEEKYLPDVPQTSYRPAINKLRAKNYNNLSLVAHSHPWQLEKDANGDKTGKHSGPDASQPIQGHPELPSDLDTAGMDQLGEIDRIVLGYEPLIEPHDPNVIKLSGHENYLQGPKVVTYYDGTNPHICSIPFIKLQKLSNKVYGEDKHKH